MIANTNGFFDGLPMHNTKKKGSASIFLSKEEREDRKLEKMLAQEEALKKRVKAHKEKVIKKNEEARILSIAKEQILLSGHDGRLSVAKPQQIVRPQT